MSAILEELTEKVNVTELELCILWVLDDAEKWEEGNAPYEHANTAAEELAAKDAETAALRERVKVLETVGRRMLNSLPVSEIEIAREALGNTNTRIILVAHDELAAALRGEA